MLINIKRSRNSAFSGSDKWRRLFSPLMNVKIPTFVGILTFMSRKISCSVELSMKKFYNLGARAILRYMKALLCFDCGHQIENKFINGHIVGINKVMMSTTDPLNYEHVMKGKRGMMAQKKELPKRKITFAIHALF